MYIKHKSNFEKHPLVKVRGLDKSGRSGWESITEELLKQINSEGSKKKILVVDCYQGANEKEILAALKTGLKPSCIIRATDVYLSEKEIKEISFPDVTDDRIFGFMTKLSIEDYMDKSKFVLVRRKIEAVSKGIILIVGCGASLIYPEPDLLVYADMARWEIQLRMRRNEISNLGINNKEESFESKYKRGYFVDWRICDRIKKKTMKYWDFVLDTHIKKQPKMIPGSALLEGLQQTVNRPFSVVPYFDAGPWGGHWMKEVCGLDPEMVNSAWCFNCVPEENSLLLGFGDVLFETPSINLVFNQPLSLLGEAVQARFGDEFPIRFDFLDTMDGGNLSLQVHPLTEYIQKQFGINYTQDESYYMLDVGENASVYLGLKSGIDGEEMIHDLKKSEQHAVPFDDQKYINKWPAKKHDHFLIPAGTIHCSGKNSLVLEISATPYIFTFKLWDWGRLGMDGKPRPINIDHGNNVIQWSRDTSWTKENLTNQCEMIEEGKGWREERTGLHESEFIETRRHWFSGKVKHNTNDGVQVINLVEGREAIVESPSNAFEPFVVHFAETFIVPACVGDFTIRPSGEAVGTECATLKAYVRKDP